MNRQTNPLSGRSHARPNSLVNLRHRVSCLLVLIVGLLIESTEASAEQVAADLTFDITNTTRYFGSFMEGWCFQVTTNIHVTDIGWFDAYGDGLSASHDIGIWDSSPQLLFSTNIASGTSASLGADTFRFISIPFVNLQTGTTYVIAGLTTSDAYIVPGQVNQGPSSVSYAPEITFLGVATGGNTFQYPSYAGSGGYARFAPNFVFSAIPEPSTAVLLGLGGGCVAFLQTRRRRTCKA
jgi:hypothetical protein